MLNIRAKKLAKGALAYLHGDIAHAFAAWNLHSLYLSMYPWRLECVCVGLGGVGIIFQDHNHKSNSLRELHNSTAMSWAIE